MSSELEVVADVRRRCVAAGEHDPLDEAASLFLKHHGLDGASGCGWRGPTGSRCCAARRSTWPSRPTPAAPGWAVGSLPCPLRGDGPVTAWSHGDHPAAARLAAAYGLERARELWVMRRPASLPLPDVSRPRTGVTVRSFRPDDPKDAEEVVRVNAAAFASHPEQGAMDLDGLRERMAEDWFDPAGLLVADSGDGLLGFHWTKRHSAELGEVYVVGIDPAAQGRGLGRVLTAAGLAHLASVGVSEVILYVESDNAAGRRLYEGLGFTHEAVDTHVQYRRTG